MASKSTDEVVLVTGFPSFRGRKMVQQLLTEPGVRVYAVVQGKFTREADQFAAELSPSQRKRLTIIDGDAAAMDLGLSGSEYRDVARRVDRIHHVAQVTYAAADPKMAEAVNIGATREILELAQMCRQLKSVVIHSSTVVSGDRTGQVLESELNAGQRFRTPVEKTLARAERLVRTYVDRLPLIVIRPAQIVGDSRTGEVDRFDGPYMLILLMLGSPQDFPIPLPTRGDSPMNLVPVDYVVRAAAHIGRQSAAIGKTFHLTDPRPLSVRRVYELVARSGGKKLPSGFIPTGVTRALLRAPGLGKVSRMPTATMDLLTTAVRYDMRNTVDILRGTGIQCPPFESYVHELVSFVRQQKSGISPFEGAELHADDSLA